MTVISDVDGTRWNLKLDYISGEGVIFPVANPDRNYPRYLKKRFYLSFPRHNVMGPE